MDGLNLGLGWLEPRCREFDKQHTGKCYLAHTREWLARTQQEMQYDKT